MSNRQIVLVTAGALLVVLGLMALWWPVYLNHYDQFGMQIACGRGFSSNLAQAADAGGDGLVVQCGTALLIRRTWAIPITVVGWLLLTGLLATWVHNSQQADEEASRG
ncbi:MAG: hypothetical protein WB785_05895 [Mycobacterium sp.]|uniref:hypothetical protein n=1 Tax=Mycobacterium sp. TaxID=1785 RepID=UPI003C35562A